MLLGTTASLTSTHRPRTFIHRLINPVSFVITRAFNPLLTKCLHSCHSFTAILTHHYAWLTSHLPLLSHLLFVLPLLARVARQCSKSICQHSMPKALCPYTHAQGHLPVQDIPKTELPPPDRHRPTRYTHTHTRPWWVTSFICLPTGGAGEHLPEPGLESEISGSSYSKRGNHYSSRCLIIQKHTSDEHMGVCSSLTRNEGK